MTNTDKQEWWEEEFDERFDHYNPKNDAGTHIPTWNSADYAEFKSFLRHVAESEYKRGVQECVGLMEFSIQDISSFPVTITTQASVGTLRIIKTAFKSLLTPSQKEL